MTVRLPAIEMAQIEVDIITYIGLHFLLTVFIVLSFHFMPPHFFTISTILNYVSSACTLFSTYTILAFDASLNTFPFCKITSERNLSSHDS